MGVKMADDWKDWWSKKLRHPEWQEMRIKVLEREGFKCESPELRFGINAKQPNFSHSFGLPKLQSPNLLILVRVRFTPVDITIPNLLIHVTGRRMLDWLSLYG